MSTVTLEEHHMERAPGMSVRLKLTLSYAGFLMLAGALLLAAVWAFLLRYVPDRALLISSDVDFDGVFPVRSNLLREFAPRAAIVLVCLLAFGLVGGWLLAGRMLAPMTRITEATRRAAEGSLSHRIALPGRRDEFRELADAFDTMLARLDAQVDEQRRFAANASHELRTPLAVTQAVLDAARDDPDPDVNDLLERLSVVNRRAIELTEALLLLSRANQRAFAREPVDLSLLAEEATETLVPIAEQRRVAIDTECDAAPTVGSSALLLQLTMNLIHNAVVHNLSDGGTVWVRTASRPTGVVLRVENTGEPLGPDAIATFAEPFLRGTERVRRDHAGVGLGLAIVDRVARAHDGTLTLSPRPGGGLSVTVELPADGADRRGDGGRQPEEWVGKPRSIALDAGSGHRVVTTLGRL